MSTLDLGIKALTALAPVHTGSIISLAAPPGHGALVLLLEVLHRAQAHLVALGAASRTRASGEFAAMFRDGLAPERVTTELLDTQAPANVREARVMQALQHVEGRPAFLVLDVAALDGVAPEVLETRHPGCTVVLFEALGEGAVPDPTWHACADATWRFATELAHDGLYPAMDPMRTVGPGGIEVAKVLAQTHPRHLATYLSQPFEVAEYYTGLPGNAVEAAQVGADLERLGDVKESALEGLRYVGALPDA